MQADAARLAFAFERIRQYQQEMIELHGTLTGLQDRLKIMLHEQRDMNQVIGSIYYWKHKLQTAFMF